jgi:hypothetical protein
METLTLEKGHYTEQDNTKSYVCDATTNLRLPNGWQHIWNETHYDISASQARKVARLIKQGFVIPSGVHLYYRKERKCDCPHCQGGSIYFNHDSR